MKLTGKSSLGVMEGWKEWVKESQTLAGASDSLDVLKIEREKMERSSLNSFLPFWSQCCKGYKGPCVEDGKSVAKSVHLKISTDAQDPTSAHVNHCHTSSPSQTVLLPFCKHQYCSVKTRDASSKPLAFLRKGNKTGII